MKSVLGLASRFDSAFSYILPITGNNSQQWIVCLACFLLFWVSFSYPVSEVLASLICNHFEIPLVNFTFSEWSQCIWIFIRWLLGSHPGMGFLIIYPHIFSLYKPHVILSQGCSRKLNLFTNTKREFWFFFFPLVLDTKNIVFFLAPLI